MYWNRFLFKLLLLLLVIIIHFITLHRALIQSNQDCVDAPLLEINFWGKCTATPSIRQSKKKMKIGGTGTQLQRAKTNESVRPLYMTDISFIRSVRESPTAATSIKGHHLLFDGALLCDSS